MTVPARRAHGPTVRALRVAAGRRLHDIADLAHVSLGWLSRIEREREIASEGVTIRIARALDIPVEVLTGQTPAVADLARLLEVPVSGLAASAGVAESRMQSIVDGVAGPTPAEVDRISVRLGVDADALGLKSAAVA